MDNYLENDYVRGLIGFAAALSIIGLFTWQVGWDAIITQLTQVRLQYAVPAAIMTFTGLVLLGVAWWIAVRDVTDMGLIDGIRVFFITFFANSVTPLGQFGGEPFIAYILSQDQDIPFEKSLGAVVVADIINAVPFFTLSLFGIFVFLIFFPLDPLIATILKLIVALALALITVLALIYTNENRALHVIGHISQRIYNVAQTTGLTILPHLDALQKEEITERGQSFFSILRDLTDKKQMVAKALIVSHIANILSPLSMWLFVMSLGIDAPISALFFIIPASMLAGYLPLPGGLGGIEVALTALLVAVTGVPDDIASAATLLFRVSTYWVGLLIGGYLASQLSVSVINQQINGD